MARTLIARTDILDIKEDHGKSYLTIRYTNSIDLDGISYSLVAGKPYFEILVQAKFSKPRDKEETENLDLSDGSTETLVASVKKQIQFSTSVVPFYVHQILRRIFVHNYFTIAGVEFKKEETYEQKESDEKSEFVSAQVWLTPKNENYLLNIYGTV